MRYARPLTTFIAILSMFAFLGCGDGDTIVNPPPPPPVTPSASIDVTGNGALIVHPSIDPTYCCTTEFPIRLEETAGGAAIWNFFRVSYFLNGDEVERAEQGATAIRDAGYRDIAAKSTTELVVYIRDNATDFDDVRILLGFIDKKDSRQFEHRLALNAFSNVGFNPIPAVLPPEGRTFAIVEASGR
jgi:hypothetical protein